MLARHAVVSTKWVEVALALGVLCGGSLVYVVGRSAVGWAGNNLPTFAHTFSFVILTWVWLGGTRQASFLACAIWLSIDSAFEVAQHPPLARHIVPFIPSWFDGLPILGRADAYFASGTFDSWDLISIAGGAIAAYLVIALSKHGTIDHE